MFSMTMNARSMVAARDSDLVASKGCAPRSTRIAAMTDPT
jgi:hypothetical protein